MSSKDKESRRAALEKLKQRKQRGEKNKFEISEECEQIYEDVDEERYAEIVNSRREDSDWIVDDDGSGYVEDGRDIFDDDLADGVPGSKKSQSERKHRKNSDIRNPNAPIEKKSADIKSFFSAGAVKKPQKQTVRDIDEADVSDLLNMMHEVSGLKSSKTGVTPSANGFSKPLANSQGYQVASTDKGFSLKNGSSFPVQCREPKAAFIPFAAPKGRADAAAVGSRKGQTNLSTLKISDDGSKISIKRSTSPSSPAKPLPNQQSTTPSKPKPSKSAKTADNSKLLPKPSFESLSSGSQPAAKPKKGKLRYLDAERTLISLAPGEDFEAAVDAIANGWSSEEEANALRDISDSEMCAVLQDDDDDDKQPRNVTISNNAAGQNAANSSASIAESNRGFLQKNSDSANNGAGNAIGSIWSETASQQDKNAAAMDASSNNSDSDLIDLPLQTNSRGETCIQMYLLDAYEDSRQHPGTVYLFGKIKAQKTNATPSGYASCCVVLRNLERRVYFLARAQRSPDVDEEDDAEAERLEAAIPKLYQEVTRLMEKRNCKDFRVKPVEKHYAFDLPDVPRTNGSYMELRYSFSNEELPRDLSGEYFSRVFGTTSTGLELLWTERQIRSPCWIEISHVAPSQTKISWCQVELCAAKPNSVEKCVSVLPNSSELPVPPVAILALNIKTAQNVKTRQNEIVAIAVFTNAAFPLDKNVDKPSNMISDSFCLITQPTNRVFPFDFKSKLKLPKNAFIKDMPNERALLSFFLAKLQTVDADVIIGHDTFGFEIGAILSRIAALKVPNWSRLSRLRRSIQPKLTGSKAAFFEATAGRFICDAKVVARELIRCRSYELTDLVAQVLKEQREELQPEQIFAAFNKSDDLLKLIDLTMTDAFLTLRIVNTLNALPLAAQITFIVGGILSRTLLGGRSERNEYLLVHAFHEKNYICPDRFAYGKKGTVQMVDNEDGDPEATELVPVNGGGKRKPAYTGGLVLEPKKGFYDTFVLLLDFNSLYPSIIQEFNICFTTLEPPEKFANPDELPELPDASLKPGILPTEIRKLVESRKQVKQLMKQSSLPADKRLQYDIRQLALKLTANSMYGCLGFSHSRFYAKRLAALVTAKGREILLHTKEMVEKMGLDVIYGDTDSIMINTNSRNLEDVTTLGKKIKTEVNKLYRLLELEMDGVFKSMLLLKKKKYAALKLEQRPDGTTTTSEELKGLDIVRRDWCQLAKDAGTYAIREILGDKPREAIVDAIHQKLREIAAQVNAGEVLLENFEINKQLTKSPSEYADAKSLPHVQVALRLNAKGGGGKELKQGDTISYIICEDGTTNAATQRAYHSQELKENAALKIDAHYYLAHQVHPVVSRLCDPIEGTDSGIIADCLGLDATQYRNRDAHHDAADNNDELLGVCGPCISFEKCEPFRFRCINPSCAHTNEIKSAFIGSGSTLEPSLQRCSNEKCGFALPTRAVPVLVNNLQLQIRDFVTKYYKLWFVCSDPMCGFRTRSAPMKLDAYSAMPLCPACAAKPHSSERDATLKLEYTEADLFAQLSYFQEMFDLESAITQQSLSDDVASKMRKDFGHIYSELKDLVDGWLRCSAYSEVNLSKLFECLTLPSTTASTRQRVVYG